LTISGECKLEERRNGKNFHSLKSQYGSFNRSFFIPEAVIEDQVEAAYENRMLKLVFSKHEKKVLKFFIAIK
jgi:HSP20 family protein